MSSGPLAVERATTSQRVASALRDELLAGTYKPGTPLRDVELAERAGVGRSTMREALGELAREGLLTHAVNRGMEVRRVTAEDLADIYATREIIEGAGLAALVRRPTALGPLEAAFGLMVRGAEEGSLAAVADADIAFHLALARAAGSKRLVEAQRRALNELRLVLAVTDRAYDGGTSQVDDHRALLEILRTGSLPKARTALNEHLRSAATLVELRTRPEAP